MFVALIVLSCWTPDVYHLVKIGSVKMLIWLIQISILRFWVRVQVWVWEPLTYSIIFCVLFQLQKVFVLLVKHRPHTQKLHPRCPNRKPKQTKTTARLGPGWAAPPPRLCRKLWPPARGQKPAVTTVWCTSPRCNAGPALTRVSWVKIPAAPTRWTMVWVFLLIQAATASPSRSARWICLQQQSTSSPQRSQTASRGRRWLPTSPNLQWGKGRRRDRMFSREGTGGGTRLGRTELPTTAETTLVARRLSVTAAVKPWPAWRTWRPTWGSIQARSRSSARCAASASPTPATWNATRAFTPERNATAASTVANASPSQDPWRSTWQSTRTANSSGVRTAARRLYQAATCGDTSPCTLGRSGSPPRCSDVGQALTEGSWALVKAQLERWLFWGKLTVKCWFGSEVGFRFFFFWTRSQFSFR